MASKKNRTPARQPQRPAQGTAKPLEDLLADIENHTVPPDVDGDDPLPSAAGAPDDLRVLEKELREAWASATRAKDLWRRASERADAREAAFDSRERALRDEKQELTKLKNDVTERERAVVADERSLEDQRADAAAGFASEQTKATEQLRNRRDALQVEINGLEEELASRRAVGASEERAALASERVRLEADLGELARARAEHERAARDLDADRALFEQEKALQKRQREHERELAEADLALKLARPERLRQKEVEAREAAEAENAEMRSRLDRLGERPERLVEENARLRTEIEILQDRLTNVPDDTLLADLRAAADRTRQAELDAGDWRRQRDEAVQRLERQLIAVGDVETARDINLGLERQNAGLRAALEEMGERWGVLQGEEAEKKPFVTLSNYDDNPAMHRVPSTRSGDLDLRSLTDEVRSRMAGEREFYYAETDVRLFLAGLASSRLHLLQGISGTGKTSLPIEFFNALGGQSSVVEVQAGWRDKDDLFGFYNAFEKRFSETEFTKALYRALLPANANVPAVIVLDEMNLAHPEQYFSTMLSKLENVERGAVLDILNSPVPNVPARFTDGSKMPLAPHVWFVGTANHDETTVSFADKTYDRAHVQELPHTYEPFPAQAQEARDPVSFSALQDAFAAAQKEHKAAADRARRFLAEDVRPLFTPLRIGWANRLNVQLGRFVPVDLAAGGSLTEAVDHVIEAKIMRKLRDQFEITSDQLADLRDQLAEVWDRLEPGSPTRSLTKLDDEMHRLKGGLG
ncbi:AAA domain-containing protein [Nocardioides sp. zg-1308]|uniref:AAA family ATPase n=1 Tax=Nocardioides sp. zg-1308 TaxID=2736253 RepID=UPI001557FB7E|nr:AAA family ATPase [Nocardioides sp. zg-1308]NPD06538.1 AAA domain-containing protein [Nocardioides sp. zg-1308]